MQGQLPKGEFLNPLIAKAMLHSYTTSLHSLHYYGNGGSSRLREKHEKTLLAG